MKKSVTIFAAAIFLFSFFTFASGDDKVNARIKAAFLNDFSTASDVSWEKTRDFYLATFTINNFEVNAAYNEEGELVGTSRAIESSQMPLNISLALAKKYEGYTLSKKTMELTYDGVTSYYLTVVNEHQTLKLKCSVNGNIEVERKIKRKQ